MKRLVRFVLICSMISLLLVSCSNGSETAASTQFTETPAIEDQTPTTIPTPTATPVPLAMTINGQGITQAEYDVQKQQLLSAATATGKTLTDEEVSELLRTYFVEQDLLAQAAYAAGYLPTDADVQTRLQEMKDQMGGDEAYQNWLTSTQTTEEIFILTFKRELAAQYQRDLIIGQVGDTAEQIHAIQILVDTQEEADQIYRQLQGGADFAELAATYDTITKGDLGWFPQGYLFLSEIEEKLFALQPGQYTEVLQSDYGYHIILVKEREENHPLTEAAQLELQHLALSNWLQEQESASTIEVLQ